MQARQDESGLLKGALRETKCELTDRYVTTAGVFMYVFHVTMNLLYLGEMKYWRRLDVKELLILCGLIFRHRIMRLL